MKKRILSMLTAAMMSSTCFFVGAEQICAAEYPSFTLRLNQQLNTNKYTSESHSHTPYSSLPESTVSDNPPSFPLHHFPHY